MQSLFCKCENIKSKCNVLGMEAYLCNECFLQYPDIVMKLNCKSVKVDKAT